MLAMLICSLLKYDDLRQRVSLVHTAREFAEVVDELGQRCERERESEEGQRMEARARQLFKEIGWVFG